MVNKTKILSELSKIVLEAMNTLSGLKKEIETIVKIRVEKAINKMNLVRRDEFEVLKKIVQKLANERMVILIAHRLKTIESCDKIIFLKNGQLSGFDNFENLIKNNEDFKKLTEISSSQKKN